MIVLSIILFVLLIVLLLPIGAEIQYEHDISLWVRIAGLRFLLKSKAKKQASSEKKEKKETKESPETKKESFLRKIRSVRSTVSLIRRLLGAFCQCSRKRIWFRCLDISVSYGAEDAAQTAISVGGIWSALYALLPALDQVFMVKSHHFSVEPEYNRSTFSICVNGIVGTRLVHIIVIGTVLLFEYLRFQIKERKAVKKHE